MISITNYLRNLFSISECVNDLHVNVNNINLDANDICPPPSPDIGYFGSQDMDTSYEQRNPGVDDKIGLDRSLEVWPDKYLETIEN